MTQALKSKLESELAEVLLDCEYVGGEVTIHIAPEHLVPTCKLLRDHFYFEQLMDSKQINKCHLCSTRPNLLV